MRRIGTPAAGTIVEAVVEAARDGVIAAQAFAAVRHDAGALGDRPDLTKALAAGIEAAGRPADGCDAPDRRLASSIGAGLEAAAKEVTPGTIDGAVLRLLWSSWQGDSDAEAARDRVRTLLAGLEALNTSRPRLAVAILVEYAYWLGRAANLGSTPEFPAFPVEDPSWVLAGDHAQVLVARGRLGIYIDLAGDSAAARDIFAGLAADFAHVAGAEHAKSHIARRVLAECTGRAGNTGGACAMYAQLVAESARCFGADDDRTLVCCARWAQWAVEADDVLGCLVAVVEVLSLRGAKAGTVAAILSDLLLLPAAGPYLAHAPDVVALLIEVMPRVTPTERVRVAVTLMVQSALMPPAMRVDAAVRATALLEKPAEFLVALTAAVNGRNPCFRAEPAAIGAWIDAMVNRPGWDFVGSWARDLVAASAGDAQARLRLPSEFLALLEELASPGTVDTDG